VFPAFYYTNTKFIIGAREEVSLLRRSV